MTVGEIIQQLDRLAPRSAALDWDNVGLLVGSEDWDVKNIYVALDATEEVIEHAISQKADLIVTHHPMIFSSMKQVTDQDLTGRRIMKLLENHIALFAMHTNFDIYKMGELADSRLGLTNTVPLEVIEGDRGLGSVGDLKEEMTLFSFAEFVRDSFGLTNVKVFGPAAGVIHRVAMLPGSGKSEIPLAIEAGADLLITGDIDHHSGIDAVQEGLSIIDAGHYGIEHIFMEYMEPYLASLGNDLTVFREPMAEPFYIV